MSVNARGRESTPKIVEIFPYPGGEKHLRVQLRAVEFSSRQRFHRKDRIGHRDPAVVAVESGDVLCFLRTVHDRGALPRGFRKNFYRYLTQIGVKARVGPFGGKASNRGQSLCPAERLNIFVEDLIGGR